MRICYPLIISPSTILIVDAPLEADHSVVIQAIADSPEAMKLISGEEGLVESVASWPELLEAIGAACL